MTKACDSDAISTLIIAEDCIRWMHLFLTCAHVGVCLVTNRLQNYYVARGTIRGRKVDIFVNRILARQLHPRMAIYIAAGDCGLSFKAGFRSRHVFCKGRFCAVNSHL